jgi:hypothetical protein
MTRIMELRNDEGFSGTNLGTGNEMRNETSMTDLLMGREKQLQFKYFR